MCAVVVIVGGRGGGVVCLCVYVHGSAWERQSGDFLHGFSSLQQKHPIIVPHCIILVLLKRLQPL